MDGEESMTSVNPWLHGEPFALLSDEDGSLHVVLAEGLAPTGYV
jgi:hypothetical protein